MMGDDIKLTREELYERVWQKPARDVADELLISDVALGKICRKMDVPKPPRGYWERIRAGAKVPRTPLPKLTTKTRAVTWLSRREVVKVPDQLEEMLNDPSFDKIRVSNGFDNLHPLVANTREYIAKAEPAEDGLIKAPSKNYLRLIVSREQADRAILIMDAILKECERRGYRIEIAPDYWSSDTKITKEGEAAYISLYEKSHEQPVELTADQKKLPPYLLTIPPRFRPEGKLHVKVRLNYGSYRRISDRQKDRLEDRLDEVMAEIIFLLESRVAEKRKRETEERRRKENERRYKEEIRRRETLEKDASAWNQSDELSRYLDAYEAKLHATDPNQPRFAQRQAWLNWARRFAARLDPLNKYFEADEVSK